MKSTYKLFGTYWNGMDSDGYENLTIKKVPSGNLPKDTISFKDLLNVEDNDSFENIIESIARNNDVKIHIDYWAESSNPVLNSFLEMRLSQMVSHLSKRFQYVHCIIT